MKCIHVIFYNTCICTVSLPHLLSDTHKTPGPESAPLTSKQPSGWKRGQNTAAAHTSSVCTRLCARPRSAHCSDPSQWQCVCELQGWAWLELSCACQVLLWNTLFYTRRGTNTAQIHTHIHSHNPHPRLKQKHDTSVLVSTWKLYFTKLIIMDGLKLQRFYFHHIESGTRTTVHCC